MKLVTRLFVVLITSLLLTTPLYAKGNNQQRVTVLARDQIITTDYFAAGDVVTISGTVQGDAYVAGGVVVVDGTIEGDLFAAGGTVTIAGPILHDLRVAGGTVIVRAPISGNATIAGGNVSLEQDATISGSVLAGAGTMEIAAPIGRGLIAGAGNLWLNNHVTGNVTVGAESFMLMQNAAVDGTLSYWSEKELTTTDGATVSGIVTRHEPPAQIRNRKEMSAQASNSIKTAMAGFATLFVFSKIVWGLILFVAGISLFNTIPVFTQKTLTSAGKTPWNHFLTGLAIVIVVPIVGAFLLLTIVGIPAAIVAFTLLGLLAIIVHMFTALFVGKTIMHTFGGTHSQVVSYLLGLISLAILHFVPFVGPVICGGLGLLILGALMSEKSATYKLMREKKII